MIVTHIAILSADIPVFFEFAHWDPPDFRPQSLLLDHVSNILWIICMPAALIGISFILAHVHVVCGILFSVFSFVATCFTLDVLRSLNEVKLGEDLTKRSSQSLAVVKSTFIL